MVGLFQNHLAAQGLIELSNFTVKVFKLKKSINNNLIGNNIKKKK